MRGPLAFFAAVAILLACGLAIAAVYFYQLPSDKQANLRSAYNSRQSRDIRSGALFALVVSLAVTSLFSSEWEGTVREYLAWVGGMYLPLACSIAVWVRWMRRHFPAEWKRLVSGAEISLGLDLPKRVWVASTIAVVVGLLPAMFLVMRMP